VISPEDTRRQTIEHTRREYQNCYDRMRFPSPEVARNAGRYRAQRVDRLSHLCSSNCANTKFFSKTLPPGCMLCANEAWSCLFVNGACNADCFFCPKNNERLARPTADNIIFGNVEDYTRYLRLIGSRGMGISGGEPLLNSDLTLEFISGVRSEFGDAIHIWLYSNGLLASEDILRKLRAAGLDEIRFNIAANGYKLDAVHRATQWFDHVVVEIPAIPEDAEEFKHILPQLSDIGIKGLNLHQLWCSPKSAEQLSRRDYTFLHGSRVSVLESELLALEVLDSAANGQIGLPVHYCSAAYKQRFQTAATLRRDANLVVREYEDITEVGLIRQLSVNGSPEELREQLGRFDAAGARPPDYCLDEPNGRLYCTIRLWNSVDLSSFTPRLRYDLVHRTTAGNGGDTSLEFQITDQTSLHVKRTPVHIQPAMSQLEQRAFSDTVVNRISGDSAQDTTMHDPTTPFSAFEWIDIGLPDYF
jgi:pyruvate formate-lyase activating enzyme-like uncharacterized protein